MMKSKRCKGWAVIEWIKINGDSKEDSQCVNVNLQGVCSCSWRKNHCDPKKECRIILSRCEEYGPKSMLRKLMGKKKFPRSWDEDLLWMNTKQWNLYRQAVDKFSKKFYKQCRPVQVEVKTGFGDIPNK